MTHSGAASRQPVRTIEKVAALDLLVVPPIASRSTVPPTGVVMLASIFIASMVATTPPASTVSPSATDGVTTPEKGAGTWPAWPGRPSRRP